MMTLATAVDGPDPGTGLAAVAAWRGLADELEALHVSHARAQGWSWEAICPGSGRTCSAGTDQREPMQRERGSA
jgi:hypothetical protein